MRCSRARRSLITPLLVGPPRSPAPAAGEAVRPAPVHARLAREQAVQHRLTARAVVSRMRWALAPVSIRRLMNPVPKHAGDAPAHLRVDAVHRLRPVPDRVADPGGMSAIGSPVPSSSFLVGPRGGAGTSFRRLPARLAHPGSSSSALPQHDPADPDFRYTPRHDPSVHTDAPPRAGGFRLDLAICMVVIARVPGRRTRDAACVPLPLIRLAERHATAPARTSTSRGAVRKHMLMCIPCVNTLGHVDLGEHPCSVRPIE